MNKKRPLRIWKKPAGILTKKLLTKRDARLAFTGPLTALSYNLTDKYLDEIFRRREYIFIEITKGQRLKLSKEEVQNFLKAILLLKNAVYLQAFNEPQPGITAPLIDVSFVERVLRVLKQEQKIIPEELLENALNSNLSFLENPKIEAVSRLAAYFCPALPGLPGSIMWSIAGRIRRIKAGSTLPGKITNIMDLT